MEILERRNEGNNDNDEDNDSATIDFMGQVVPGLSFADQAKPKDENDDSSANRKTRRKKPKKFKVKLPKNKKKSRKVRIRQREVRQKARDQRGKRRADAKRDAGPVKPKAGQSKRTFKCTEVVDATILKVLGKTFKTKSKRKMETVGKVHSAVPATNSSMRPDAHEQRQERKKKKNRRDDILCKKRDVFHPVTICDVGPEEGEDLARAVGDQEELDLSGPQQGPMEAMPPCMEYFKVGFNSKVDISQFFQPIFALVLRFTPSFPGPL